MKTTTNITCSALALFALACFAFSPQARAVCQEGCLTSFNTVLGDDAFLNNNTGYNNTAIGAVALQSNTIGGGNTAIGTSSLSKNTTGFNNTANGGSALGFNTTGTNNTASGWGALFENQTGIANTALGVEAAKSNNDGNFNTATGYQALQGNSGGSFNTATGYHALQGNSTGQRNIGLGFEAGKNIITGSDNIDIGNVGRAGESGIVRIGTAGTHTATFIAGIRETALSNGGALAVGIAADGQLGVRVSSAQFKEAIKPMNKASEAIFSLQPVTFRYKKDPAAMAQFGLVAEEVAKVSPDLVARDKEGKPFTVRYDEVNAMLLNEFLKEHCKVEEQTRLNREQEATIADLRAALKHQAEQLATLTSKMQRVSDQLQTSGTKLQTVAGNQ